MVITFYFLLSYLFDLSSKIIQTDKISVKHGGDRSEGSAENPVPPVSTITSTTSRGRNT